MSDFMGLGAIWLATFAIFAAAGLWLFVTGVRNLFRGRLVRGPVRGACGAALGGLALGGAGLGLNLHTYHAFNYEAPVATVEFTQRDRQQYEARITTNGVVHELVIHGDEWQLDARVLKWQGAGVMLGLKPVYRLERFSGRYTRVYDEQQARRSVYGLHGAEPGIDLWETAQMVEKWVPLVDTVYGSATYLPMADGAQFKVSISEDALIARPGNAEAVRAVRRW